MTLNEYNRSIIGRLRESVDRFVEGELDLDRIQAELSFAVGLLENDGTGVADLVRLAENDVEEIRFTRLLEEQRPAVIFRIDQLLEQIPDDEH